MSSGPASASQNDAQSYFGQTVATPDAMSPPTNFPASSSAMSPSAGPSAAMPPPAVPPTPTDGGKRKITLKVNKSQPSTPIAENPPNRTPLPTRTPLPVKPPPTETPVAPLTTTKAGRTSKPSARKRAQNDENEDEEEVNGAKPPPQKRPKMTIKMKTSGGEDRRNSINIKRITKVDNLTSNSYARQPGSGFDSELEDAEPDPITEEEIVLRMMEGPECDYINECLNSKKFPSGGMNFKLKWVEERRAAVTVEDKMFAAVLVDLPTITEATKTWDKKLVVKSADICQMLLVFKRITNEAEARTAELPRVIFDGFRWPHGLTPPMHDAVHRRFRKRLHKSEILNKEQEVERLLKADKNAISTRYEYIGERRGTMQIDTPNADMIDADGEEDAEGEIEDIVVGANGLSNGFEGVDVDLEAELQRELEAGMEDEFSMDTPAEAGATPAAPVDTPAPGAEAGEAQGDEDLFGDGESGEDYDEDDEESDEDLDPVERERREQIRGVRDELKDIDRNIEKLEDQIAAQANVLLRQRLQQRLKGVKEDKRLKLASIGEVPPEDDDEEE